MSFLYPIFLVAGLTIAIPLLIHLFNLRRYKTVFFPHTRFLKNIELHSRRQSQVRYKWLLAARIAFLLLLVLAFAQPFFSRNGAKQANKLHIIYIDNSYSMSVKAGSQRLLDLARNAALKQVAQSPAGTRFILMTNDKGGNAQPITPEKAMAAINAIEISAAPGSSDLLLKSIRQTVQSASAGSADVYYFSDFQASGFTIPRDTQLTSNIHFYGVPVQSEQTKNVFIDTAYLTVPALQAGQNNQLVVRSRSGGDLPKDAPVVQLSVDGQVKSAAGLRFNEKKESIDTLSFQLNDAGWHKILLTVNDGSVLFDDTFRVAARSTPGLSVLVLNGGQVNPFIQAAFHAYAGFKLVQTEIANAPKELKDYNLVILNEVAHIDPALVQTLNNALQSGQTVCIFPARNLDRAAMNESLKAIADIRFEGTDTAAQAAATLQQGSDLVKDLFEQIPENVQLPTANWHHIIRAGLNANQQAVLSFRNGDPFFAKYTPARGALYIAAGGADMRAGTFAGSYFFVPFLYQMAMQSGGSDVYALTAGNKQAAYIPLNNAGERNMIHITAQGVDMIPAQRTSGAGLEVFVDQSVQAPGFYTLTAQGSDSVSVALNTDRKESDLTVWKLSDLKKQWENKHVDWLELNRSGGLEAASGAGSFPLWKVCAILALFMLALETILLAGFFQKQTVATQQ